MKSTVTNLAVSNIKKNRSRSILIMISVFLTTMLLSVIAAFGYGIVKHNRLNAGTIYGNYYGTFSRVSQKQYETIKLRSEFTNIGRAAYAAEVAQEEASMNLSWMDQDAAENINFSGTLKEGRLPRKENEVAAPEEFFGHLGVEDPKPGDHVLISFRKDHQSKFETREFIISGIVSSVESGDLKRAYQGYVSQEFYEGLVPQEMRSFTVTFRLNESVEINSDNAEEVLQKLGAYCGVKKDNVSVNTGYLMWAFDPGLETLTACVGIAWIVILVSVVVIYNIFQVGIVQKIQEYGKIKALGATKKQLKKVIFREGMALSLAAVPPGLAAGTGLASVLFRNLIVKENEDLLNQQMIPVSVVSLPMFLLVAVISIFTVWLALKKPMRVVASISPVEAIRYQENTSYKKAVRKGRKQISVFGMTASHLSANCRRTMSTICTMGLSCVLFVALSNVAGNIDNEYEARRQVEYGQFSIELDYDLTDTAYPENNLENIQKDNPLGKEFQEKLKAIPGVTRVKQRVCFAAENKSLSEMDEDGSKTSVCVLDREDFKRYGTGSTLGTVDYDKVSAQGGIIFGYSHFMESSGYSPGDKLTLDILDAGEKAAYEGGIMGAFGSAPASWVITEDTYKALNLKGDLTGQLWVDCEEKDKVEVEKAINELLAGVSHVEMQTYDNAMKIVKMSTNLMQTGIYTFLAILGVIGFMNMANTIITGVVTRKRELGVLQAVGMTNQQLNQMLQLEGILFSVGTVLVSLAVGCPLGYGLFRYAKGKHIYGMNQYHFPMLEIGIMIGVIVLLQTVLSYLLSKNLRKESLVERINYQG